MAHLYYSHSVNRRGILRAVLSAEEARCLLKGHAVKYVGAQFPAGEPEAKSDFAVLCISETESAGGWQAGFYLFDENLTQVDEALQAK